MQRRQEKGKAFGEMKNFFWSFLRFYLRLLLGRVNNMLDLFLVKEKSILFFYLKEKLRAGVPLKISVVAFPSPPLSRL